VADRAKEKSAMRHLRNHGAPVIIAVALLVLTLLLMGCNLLNLAERSLEQAVEEAQATPPQAVATERPRPSATLSPTPPPPPPITSDVAEQGDVGEEPLVQLYERVNPSVVNIRIQQRLGARRTLPGDDFFGEGQGSGFVWDTEGHIVTNNHVVATADRVLVTFHDDTASEARVVGTDLDSDLAVIRVDLAPSHLRPVTLGDSDALKVGQRAIAIGNPFGQAGTMTQGIISALGRTFTPGQSSFAIPEMIQTDAAINPGNSGGPLLDSHGRVIGVNNLILSRTGLSAGVGFAVPIDIVKQVVPVLIEGGEYAYPWLGITGTDLDLYIREELDLPSDLQGTLVLEVIGGGPADRSGLRGGTDIVRLEGRELPVGGDIILAIDGQPVRGIDDVVIYLVRNTQPGQEVQLAILRQEEEHTIRVVLGERPEELRKR
jgi:S1-C subfamily serine protease